MKQWKKIAGIVVGMIVVCVVSILLFGNQKECCLCNNPRYSALCLIDLETGDVLELSLDDPTTSHSTSLPSYAETFSFIRFGNITGMKQTAPNVIELKVPAEDKTKTTALCRHCRKLLQRGYEGRYVVADMESNALFPIIPETELVICGCQISMMQVEEHIRIIIC